jgi:hypothetical protein
MARSLLHGSCRAISPMALSCQADPTPIVFAAKKSPIVTRESSVGWDCGSIAISSKSPIAAVGVVISSKCSL